MAGLVFLFIATPLGMFLAVLLDKNIRGTRFYQSALYMPVVLSLAIVGFIWQLIYSPDQGLLNNILGTTRASRASSTGWATATSTSGPVLVAASWRHIGYVMVLYLAGLKAVDPSLREAAQIDGANERQTFFRVVFPVLRPINIVVLVITVIESLRAFDLAYIINKGLNGLELLSVLVTNNIIGETSRVGFGSAIAVVLLVISVGPIIFYLVRALRGGPSMTSATAGAPGTRRPSTVPRALQLAARRSARLPHRRQRRLAVARWPGPCYTSLRPYEDTARNGYVSMPSVLNLDNYVQRLEPGRAGPLLPEHR